MDLEFLFCYCKHLEQFIVDHIDGISPNSLYYSFITEYLYKKRMQK